MWQLTSFNSKLYSLTMTRSPKNVLRSSQQLWRMHRATISWLKGSVSQSLNWLQCRHIWTPLLKVMKLFIFLYQLLCEACRCVNSFVCVKVGMNVCGYRCLLIQSQSDYVLNLWVLAISLLWRALDLNIQSMGKAGPHMPHTIHVQGETVSTSGQ